MKTTINIADVRLDEARRVAARDKTTLRSMTAAEAFEDTRVLTHTPRAD